MSNTQIDDRRRFAQIPRTVLEKMDSLELTDHLWNYSLGPLKNSIYPPTPVDISYIRGLLNRGADVLHKKNDMDLTFHISSLNDKSEILNLLIEFGADINSHNNEGVTSLHNAVSALAIKNITYLLDAGCNHQLIDDHGRSCLFGILDSDLDDISNMGGVYKTINVLCNYGINMNAIDGEGKSILHYIHNKEFFDVLVSYGANPEIRDPEGVLPAYANF